MSGALTLASPAAAELLIASVVATLISDKTKAAHAAALQEFVLWMAGQSEPLSKPLLETLFSARSEK